MRSRTGSSITRPDGDVIATRGSCVFLRLRSGALSRIRYSALSVSPSPSTKRTLRVWLPLLKFVYTANEIVPSTRIGLRDAVALVEPSVTGWCAAAGTGANVAMATAIAKDPRTRFMLQFNCTPVRSHASPGQNHVRTTITAPCCCCNTGPWRSTSRSISRVLFRCLRIFSDHLSGIAITDDLKRPTRDYGRATLSRRSFLPLGLASSGVYRASEVTLTAGGLLHHRFTLTACAAVCSLWHCP